MKNIHDALMAVTEIMQSLPDDVRPPMWVIVTVDNQNKNRRIMAGDGCPRCIGAELNRIGVAQMLQTKECDTIPAFAPEIAAAMREMIGDPTVRNLDPETGNEPGRIH